MFKANAAMKPVTRLDLKKATEMTSMAVLSKSAVCSNVFEITSRVYTRTSKGARSVAMRKQFERSRDGAQHQAEEEADCDPS